MPPRQGTSETIKLFNGTDLDGWEGDPNLWSVKDGVIVGKNTDNVPVSTYLLTERKFRDFRLVFDFKLAESEMHSGIALWGRVAPEHADFEVGPGRAGCGEDQDERRGGHHFVS